MSVPISPNIRNIQWRNGHVTFQQTVYIGGQLFKVNHQYKFDQTAELRIGCGCTGGTFEWRLHYRIRCDKNAFLIDSKSVVETNEPIPVSSQDFEAARENQHLSQQPYHDFDGIRKKNDPSTIWRLANEQARDHYKH